MNLGVAWALLNLRSGLGARVALGMFLTPAPSFPASCLLKTTGWDPWQSRLASRLTPSDLTPTRECSLRRQLLVSHLELFCVLLRKRIYLLPSRVPSYPVAARQLLWSFCFFYDAHTVFFFVVVKERSKETTGSYIEKAQQV